MRQQTQRTVIWILLGLLLSGTLAVAGCGPIATPSALPTSVAPTAAAPTAPTPAIQPPSGGCQSRIWGGVSAGGAGEPNVAVEIKGEGWSAKTFSDANGLYGFAGLCAGKYTITVVPPSGATAGESQTVTVDGSNTVKLDLVFRKP
jgi:hypothetical protein